MNIYPTIISAIVIEPYKVEIKFSDGSKKIFDFEQLLEIANFNHLTDYKLFKSFSIAKGGYGLEWNDDLDISEAELWLKGKTVN